MLSVLHRCRWLTFWDPAESPIEEAQLTVVSGGDDNALHLLKLRISNMDKITLVKQLSVMSAHASCISCIQLIPGNEFFSCSVDQRLNRWRVEDTNLELVESKLLHVSDCSDMSVVEVRGDISVCVVGVGAEFMECRFNSCFLSSEMDELK